MIPFLNFEEDFLTTEDLLFLAGASGAKGVEDTATGNPVTFITDLAKPLKSLVANFLPIQSSGTPSPDNVLPITGWTGVNVSHTGKNLFDKTGAVKYERYLSGTENSWIYSDDSSSVAIPAEPNKTYYIYTIGMQPPILRANSTSETTLSTSSRSSISCEKERTESTTGILTFTTGNNTKWLLVQVSSSLYNDIVNALVITDS